ncbi:PBP1A family penicillin-binding protein [Limosilactobacillus sp. RRLNB_1_1]|uniref:PBP1A family penicillin-binding protein n=1 Tax=Limosilactobacillus albertensis TaxID=2759752 RepID=A0A7W3Y9E7_9LACO|nr:PBP1A family penicillin-binding protein [Limosilactobacillus albertensis]MBB1070694.1 PBP1A family penicillin-binding protein [Limosilactobacillus albertensis]MCD7118960.1 PBP1A family penicillin-binding protein [Limosilactobacillus albertensis]MCD7129438.1 PBP1A family penicillin-binding protein [Limosilactobacillus albertensis]
MSNNNQKTFHIHNLIKKFFIYLSGIIIILIFTLTILFFYYVSSAPKISEDDLSRQNITTIYDNQDRVISRLGIQKIEYAKNNQIPSTLKNAIVSIEDRRFYKHHGIDLVRIFGAAVSNIFGHSSGMQGGSTLTQQLVKLSVFSTADSDRTFKRKAQEAWLAINVERHFTKSQILDFYINKAYMGNGIYGMQTAAQYYYGKDLMELNLSELALLAGMPQSPTYYNPATGNLKYATNRRNEVLNAMVRNKYITQGEAKQASHESITSGLDPNHGNVSSSDPNVKEKFIDSYIKEILDELQAQGYNPYKDGLKVHTNLDLNAQLYLYTAANKLVPFQNNKMQTGIAVINPHNGKIIAMLGGRHTGNIMYGLNRAVQTNRSSGSTAKPIMDYGPAIEYLDWPTFKTVQDNYFTFPGTHTVLYDFDKKYKGAMTMRDALIQSRNVPAIRSLQEVGLKKSTIFLKKLGISQKEPYTLQNGIALYISPLQVAAAYAAFANGGIYYKPYYINSITTQDGKTKRFSPNGKRAMKESTAYMITDMLKGVFSDPEGSGIVAQISGVNQAGKTGTTNYPKDSKKSGVMDSWMVGYTKNYSIAVWTGYDHPFQSGSSISERYTKSSQLLYRAIMKYLDYQNHAQDWIMPNNVQAIKVNNKRQLAIYGSKWANSTENNYNLKPYSNNSTIFSSSSSFRPKENINEHSIRDNQNSFPSSSNTTSSSTSNSTSERINKPIEQYPNNNITVR